MTGFGKWQLKNQMVLDNIISNLTGLFVVDFASHRNVSAATTEAMKAYSAVEGIYVPLIVIIIGWTTIRFERPLC